MFTSMMVLWMVPMVVNLYLFRNAWYNNHKEYLFCSIFPLINLITLMAWFLTWLMYDSKEIK